MTNRTPSSKKAKKGTQEGRAAWRMAQLLPQLRAGAKVAPVVVVRRTAVPPATPAAPSSERPAPTLPPRVTAERLAAAARALRAAGVGAVRLGGGALPIRAHIESEPSPFYTEVMRAQATAELLQESRPPSFLARQWMRLRAQSLGREDLRLNPHRPEAAFHDQVTDRLRQQTAIPQAIARSVSELSASGLEAVSNVVDGWRAPRARIQPITGHSTRATGWLEAGQAIGADVWSPVLPDNEIAAEPPRDVFAEPDPGYSWPRALLSVALIAVALAVPLKLFGAFGGLSRALARVSAAAHMAVASVERAGDAAANQDVPAAAAALASASAAFSTVRGDLGPVGNAFVALAASVPGSSRLSAGAVFLSAGETLTRAAEDMTATLAEMPPQAPPTAVIRALRDVSLRHADGISEAAQALQHVSLDDVPETYRGQAQTLIGAADVIDRGFTAFVPLTDALLAFLGEHTPRRYIFVFQNQNELRPTGGFIGSFAEVTVSEGKISQVFFPPGGSYDIQGDVRAWLNPPDPLRLVTSRWRFHDANWFADFPTSARKLAWFYEKSGGPTVDGVVAVNATVLKAFIEATGPVEMPAYGVTLTADNVLDTIQHAIELHPADPAKPKQILTDLFPVLLERLRAPNVETSLALSEVVGRALREKHIQLFATDPVVQSALVSSGWDGGLRQTEGDYLHVVTTNIGGEKTDAVMRDQVTHEAEIGADGQVTDTVTLTRTHTGMLGQPLTGVRNISYVRVFVPAGSTLLSAGGDFATPPANLFVPKDPAYSDDADVAATIFVAEDAASGVRTMEESGKTVFAHWMQVLPGETKSIRLRYRLPNRVALPAQGLVAQLLGSADARAAYTLLVQKQSGAEARTFTSTVRLPTGMQLVHARPGGSETLPGSVRFPEQRWAADTYFGLLFRW